MAISDMTTIPPRINQSTGLRKPRKLKVGSGVNTAYASCAVLVARSAKRTCTVPAMIRPSAAAKITIRTATQTE